MNSEKQLYQSVSSSDSFASDDEEQSHSSGPSDGHYTRVRKVLWYIAQVALVIVIIGQAVAIVLLGRRTQSSCRSARKSFHPPGLDYTVSQIMLDGMELQRTEPRTLYQHSKYISSDEQEADEAWESILAGHGVIAIEPEYASAKNLPESVLLPNSGGKHAYVIEAYHAIHCVVRSIPVHAFYRTLTKVTGDHT